jgi:hypothetical protein
VDANLRGGKAILAKVIAQNNFCFVDYCAVS